jgi:ABC-type lipoprotein release transport system permease subunit
MILNVFRVPIVVCGALKLVCLIVKACWKRHSFGRGRVGMAALVGICSGLYPAYQVSILDPIVALRHE